MENSGSILDKVLSSKKTTEIEQFNPSEVVSLLFKNLTSREEDVLRKRHGLLGKDKETLERIGELYHVTRERIRQIEKSGIGKIKSLHNFQEIANPIEKTIISVMEHHGGIMTEDNLLHSLLNVAGDNLMNRRNILFIISELLNNKFKRVGDPQGFKKSWQLVHAPTHLITEVSQAVHDIVKNIGKPATFDEISGKFKKSELYLANQEQLSDDIILSYLEINTMVSKNPYDEYGLIEWGSIIPKRMNDKIYLVLKRHGKPMHFNDITNKINEIKFDNRKAYPPTVHNELILNEKYVLVGRGIYALKEWGYQPGVVANVIEEILKKENKPL